MTPLCELAEKYGADKGPGFHCYTERYHAVLNPMRESAKKILEIGVAGGNSLRMWAEYFPYATIFGMDHNPACGDIKFESYHIQVVIDEASLDKTWQRFARNWGGGFDFICDDGGHFPHQIIGAFEGAWPLVKPGGLYAIEDTHFVYTNDDLRRQWEYWIVRRINNVDEVGAGQCGKPQRDTEDIDSITFSKSLCIIKKRL